MDVDINGLGVDREIYEIVWLLVSWNQPLVALEYGFVEIWMAHVASVDHQILKRVAFAGVFWKPDEAVEPYD